VLISSWNTKIKENPSSLHIAKELRVKESASSAISYLGEAAAKNVEELGTGCSHL
jgi:hypothetical protein